ncbi:MAG: DEAD/DEAH box helicase, partial [Haloplanus sp.]
MDGDDALTDLSLPDGIDPSDAADADVLSLLDPAVREWWVDQFGAFVPQNGGFFTPPQRDAIPLVHGGENALICAPTGSGKTLASFIAIIN